MIYFKFLDGVSFVNNRVFDGKSVNLLCGMGGALFCYVTVLAKECPFLNIMSKLIVVLYDSSSKGGVKARLFQ